MSARHRAIALALVLVPAVVPIAAATPVRDIPGLVSITFYETTGATNAYTFAVDSPQLTTRLADPLGAGNNDIAGASTEFYDVYYSNADGSSNLDGEYLTISGVFSFGLPNGGGLNLAEIALNFSGAPTEYGNFVASFVALGDNAIPADVGNAIDGNLATFTTMGNTIGADERLRVTLGFLSSSGPVEVPEPASLGLFGLAGLWLLARSRQRFGSWLSTSACQYFAPIGRMSSLKS